jgi:hypothetical protein
MHPKPVIFSITTTAYIYNGGLLKLLTTLMFVATVLYSQSSYGEETNPQRLPWSKAGIGVGYFITTLDTDLRFGSGVAINIDAEQLL